MKLIDTKEVARRLGVSVAYLRRLRFKPGFPKPHPEFKRPLKWRESDVDRYARL